MGTQAAAPIQMQEGKKNLVRRPSPDGSAEGSRRMVQWLFVALNGWLGIQFLLWVRYLRARRSWA